MTSADFQRFLLFQVDLRRKVIEKLKKTFLRIKTVNEDRVKNIVHESCVLVTHFTPMFHFFNRLKWVKFKETYKDFKVYQRKKTLQ